MGDEFYRQYVFYTAEMLEMCDVPGIGSWKHAVLSMNCQRNVISILPTQFSYIVARFIHNYFESLNIYISISIARSMFK
jgi:hypothetical protein